MEERDAKATHLLGPSKEKDPFSVQPMEQSYYFGRNSGKIRDSIPFLPPPKKGAPTERKSVWKRVSGSALCKVTVIVYLLGCVLVSALYVALYGGQSQKLFAASDAWIPGKVSPPRPPVPLLYNPRSAKHES